MIAQFNEQLNRLLKLVDDGGLRAVAELKLQGYTNDEIATEIDRSVRTVENRLRLIRKIWSAELGP